MAFADGKTFVRTTCPDFRSRQPDGMRIVCHRSSGGFGVEFGDEELHIEPDFLSLRWNINGLREVESGVARNKAVFLSVQIQSPRDFTNDTVAIGISMKPISVDEFELRTSH